MLIRFESMLADFWPRKRRKSLTKCRLENLLTLNVLACHSLSLSLSLCFCDSHKPRDDPNFNNNELGVRKDQSRSSSWNWRAFSKQTLGLEGKWFQVVRPWILLCELSGPMRDTPPPTSRNTLYRRGESHASCLVFT